MSAPERPVVVLKVGTSSLIDVKSGAVRISSIARIVETAVALDAYGYRVVIVSSGAVGLGCARLGLTEKPTTIARKQAAAAVGQVRLMTHYDDLFAVLGHRCAQVLLTYDTFGERTQYLNARNTFLELLALGVVPIVNENDTVAVQEIRVGDNDSLSALVAAMIGARWLFLLTDVDALFDCNPTEHASAAPFRLVHTPFIQHLRKQMLLEVPRLHLTEDVAAYTPKGASPPSAAAGSAPGAGRAGSKFGTGGMVTKLKAAQLGTAAGVTVVITRTDNLDTMGRMLTPSRTVATVDTALPIPAPLPPTLFADASIGTTFLPSQRPVTGRKRWILSLTPDGALVLDAGAVEAITRARKSLFPAGVTRVVGDFDTHDAVSILAADGHEIARALVNYSAEDCRKLRGRASKEIAATLGYLGAETLADRDNIVVLKEHAPASAVEGAAAAFSGAIAVASGGTIGGVE